MGFSQIRYKTAFKTEKAAREGMKKAQAFNLVGIGSWDVQDVGGRFDLVFKPGRALRFALNKAEAMWYQVARQTEKAFRDELKTKTIVAIVE